MAQKLSEQYSTFPDRLPGYLEPGALTIANNSTDIAGQYQQIEALLEGVINDVIK